jgi:hypothetical protein
METMPARRQPPTVGLRRLAAELLALRGTRSREQVYADIGLSEAALLRIEKAKSRPHVRTLRQLMDYYGVTDPAKRAELTELLRQSRQLQWLQRFEDNLPQSYQNLIAFEADAALISEYEGSFVPGLLQTRGYTETMTRALLPEATDEEIEQRVEARTRRQAVLAKISLWAILDEAAVQRRVGDVETYRGQLEHLVSAARSPNITLQVIPFSAGAHLGMPGSFLVMEFAEPDTPLVYTENAGGGLFLEAAEDIRRYRATFQRLTAQALSPEDSKKLIQDAAEAA